MRSINRDRKHAAANIPHPLPPQELADCLLSFRSTAKALESLGKTEEAVSTILRVLTSHPEAPHPEHASLLRALAFVSEEARACLSFTSAEVLSLVSSLSCISDVDTLSPVLAALHRLAFDPLLATPDAGAAYRNLECPHQTPIHPSIADCFVLPPGVYLPTSDGFIEQASSDEGLAEATRAFFEARVAAFACPPPDHPKSSANSMTDAIMKSESGKEMTSRVEEAHVKCICLPGFKEAFVSGGNVQRALHRILSVPPSSARDHELLSSALDLLVTLSEHIPYQAFVAIVQGLTPTAVAVLDRSNVTPSMAADGLDTNGFNKPKIKYGTGLSLREAAKLEKKARRALRALWSARHAVQRFLYVFLCCPQARSSPSVGFLNVFQHLALKTPVLSTLSSHYLDDTPVDYSPEFFGVTARSQHNAINLLHLFVSDDFCCRSFASSSASKDTMFEFWLPKLVRIASATRAPDSFTGKAAFRAASCLLKSMSSSCKMTNTTSAPTSRASSEKQQREKAQWCNGEDSLNWIYKLLCDRECVVRSCGYGIAADLLHLAWAHPLVLSEGEDDCNLTSGDNEAAAGESFHRFSTTILEMACRVASDDSETPIVRSEALALLHNACRVGGAALSNSSSDVLEVIPSLGRMLARAARHMASDLDSGTFDDGDSTTAGSSSNYDSTPDEERKLLSEAVLLPTPTLLWAGVKLLRCLLDCALTAQESASASPADASLSATMSSPNSSVDSSFLQESDLASHFYESGILSHAVTLLSCEGMKRLTFRGMQAKLGVLEDTCDFSITGLAAQPTKEVWEEVEESSTFAAKSAVFDVIGLAIAIDKTSGKAVSPSDVTLSSSLLRHTSLLTQSFRALTTEVLKLAASLKGHASEVSEVYSEQLGSVASCCECLREVFDASAVRVTQSDGLRKITSLSNLIPLVGAVPQALGVALNSLLTLSSGTVFSDELDDACCSVNRLTRLLLTVPGWREGILRSRSEADSILCGLLDVHHNRALKRTNAANLPMTERLLALKENTAGSTCATSNAILSNDGRVAACSALAAAFDATATSDLDDLVEIGNKIAAMAIPGLLSEFNDTCALMALDGLRGSDGEFLEGKGRRKEKKARLLDGRADWNPNSALVFDLCAVLIALRSAVGLSGGKDACLDDTVGLINLIHRVCRPFT